MLDDAAFVIFQCLPEVIRMTWLKSPLADNVYMLLLGVEADAGFGHYGQRLTREDYRVVSDYRGHESYLRLVSFEDNLRAASPQVSRNWTRHR